MKVVAPKLLAVDLWSIFDVLSLCRTNCKYSRCFFLWKGWWSAPTLLFRRCWTIRHGKQNFGGLHWAIADTSGRSIIVEYLEGQRMVLENHPRVMTNDPDIRWHWRNLNTYVNLNPHYPWQNDILQIKTDADIGAVPRPIGHGWNLFGLPGQASFEDDLCSIFHPKWARWSNKSRMILQRQRWAWYGLLRWSSTAQGDSSPPSRFVRLFYLRGYALQSRAMTSFREAVVLGTGLLNNVFLPVGPVAGNPREPGDGPELTDYGVLKSCQEKVMLIRGYVNSQWRKIDLKRCLADLAGFGGAQVVLFCWRPWVTTIVYLIYVTLTLDSNWLASPLTCDYDP